MRAFSSCESVLAALATWPGMLATLTVAANACENGHR